jgi:hypothetical protein
MSKVIHQCPGAEQTMSMTGFDLAAMERAVGMLCDDITGNFLLVIPLAISDTQLLDLTLGFSKHFNPSKYSTK